MRSLELKRIQQQRRLRRTRKTLRSISQRPRLSVFRSNRGISAQIIDDQKGQTLAAASYLELPKKGSGMTKVEMATQIGTLLAEKATKAKITTVAFDRGSYRYHGRVKALADAARKAGLSF